MVLETGFSDYDSLIGKLIAYGQDRSTAIARMQGALAETLITGVEQSIALSLNVEQGTRNFETRSPELRHSEFPVRYSKFNL